MKRCRLHSTQLADESLHNSIWARAKKTQFHSYHKVDVAATTAIEDFNFGPTYMLSLQSSYEANALRHNFVRKHNRLVKYMSNAAGHEAKGKKMRSDAYKQYEKEYVAVYGHIGYSARTEGELPQCVSTCGLLICGVRGYSSGLRKR